MNKELIERIASETGDVTTDAKGRVTYEFDGYGLVAFRARIDAERGKDLKPIVVSPTADANEMNVLHGERYGTDWIYPPKNSFTLEKLAVHYCEQYAIDEDDPRRACVINAFCVGARLSPTIPEGYALVSIEPQKCSRCEELEKKVALLKDTSTHWPALMEQEKEIIGLQAKLAAAENVIEAFGRDCLASDFNEHWDSYKAIAEYKKGEKA